MTLRLSQPRYTRTTEGKYSRSRDSSQGSDKAPIQLNCNLLRKKANNIRNKKEQSPAEDEGSEGSLADLISEEVEKNLRNLRIENANYKQESVTPLKATPKRPNTSQGGARKRMIYEARVFQQKNQTNDSLGAAGGPVPPAFCEFPDDKYHQSVLNFHEAQELLRR